MIDHIKDFITLGGSLIVLSLLKNPKQTNLHNSMAFQIINSIISWFLKKRKHQIELFLKYPVDVQEELLLKLINTAKNTEIRYRK